MWTGCVTSWRRVEIEWFVSSRWAAHEYCDATSPPTKSRKTQTCHHCKKPVHYRNHCRQLKREKYPAQNNTNSAGNNNNSNNGGQTNSNSHNKISNNTNAINTNNQKDRKFRPVYPPGETCGKTNHSSENCYFGANAADRPPPRNRRPVGQNQVQQRNAQKNSDMNVQAATKTLN